MLMKLVEDKHSAEDFLSITDLQDGSVAGCHSAQDPASITTMCIFDRGQNCTDSFFL